MEAHLRKHLSVVKEKKMKKSIVFGALALAGAAFAVESATVGYTTKESTGAGKFVIGAAQFEAANGTTADVQELFSSSFAPQAYDLTTGELTSETWYEAAPQIQIPNGVGGYLVYYYGSNVYDEATDSVTTGWADRYGSLVSRVVAPGQGVWLRAPDSDNIPFLSSGSVLGEGTVTSTKSSFEIVGNPLPAALAINGNKVTWNIVPVQAYDLETGELTSPTWYEAAPQIQIPNGVGGYLVYYYGSNVYDEATDSVTTGWADRYGSLIDGVVPVATGAWMKNDGGFEFTVEQ